MSIGLRLSLLGSLIAIVAVGAMATFIAIRANDAIRADAAEIVSQTASSAGENAAVYLTTPH